MSHHDDVRLDVGEGPSSAPTLEAAVRVRPVTIRFTEPGVRDLELKLHSLTSLRPANLGTPDASAVDDKRTDELIFDFDAEQHPSPASPAAAPPDNQHLVRDIIAALNDQGLLGEETVRALKSRMGAQRDGVKGRRLRLIHAGRILRDGVRLVSYLEELDLRQRVQSRQTLRHLALDAARRSDSGLGNTGRTGEDSAEASEDDDDAAGDEDEQDEVQQRTMSVRELADFLSQLTESAGNPEDDASSSSAATTQRKGKGKAREPSFFDDRVRLTLRTASTVYLQCSVGEPEPSSPTSPSAVLATPLVDIHDAAPDSADALALDPLETDNAPNRGFNRLLDAGLSPSEISSIRDTFRTTHPLPQHYDLIQAREHAQHLLEMEESWMDSFHTTTTTTGGGGELGEFGEPGGRGAYVTVMEGLMVGFFLPPLIPLFWFRDKPHPSSLPSGVADEGEEVDDEDEWQRERTQLTRESVFGSTMQIAILFGLVANLTMGVFRFIW